MADHICELIGEEAMWMQLAEEASELSQAASKMARYLHGTNPVGNPYELNDRDLKVSLMTNVIEEYMDVVNCCKHLGVPEHKEVIRVKNNRWIARIEKARSELK